MWLHLILVLGVASTAGLVGFLTLALLRRDRADDIARWAGDRHGDETTSGTLRNSSRGGRT